MGVLNQFHLSLTLNETAIEVNIFSIRSAIFIQLPDKKKNHSNLPFRLDAAHSGGFVTP